MDQAINLTEWVDEFQNGSYSRNNVSTQIKAGWYDWFCQDSSLLRRTNLLGRRLISVMKNNNNKFNPETSYVFFKNNCPLVGRTYDDFRICDIESGDVIYTIVPKCSHTNRAEIWGRENRFVNPLVQGTWRDIIKFFKG